MPPDLTPERYADLLRKLDEVCEQARDLTRHLKAQMAARARGNHQLLSTGSPERKRAPRKHRNGPRT
jgi:hypothetical protein